MVQHRIEILKSDPIKQCLRQVPISSTKIALEEIQKMLDRGVIEPRDSTWASPIVLFKKKDRTTQFCMDFPLPRINECIDALGGKRRFSTLELGSGYWQIAMDTENKDKNNLYYGFRIVSVQGHGSWVY